VLKDNFYAHLFEGFEVQIYGPRPNGAPARKRNARAPMAGQHWSEHKN
jgi:hypothetical protein